MSSGKILNGLKGEDRKQMEIAVGNARGVLLRLQKLLEEEAGADPVPSFDSPNWSAEVAFNLGYRKGLTKALQYVIITDK